MRRHRPFLSALLRRLVLIGYTVDVYVYLFVVLFFFLYDGPGIWAWIVRLFPRGARAKVLSSGAIAWNQLKAFTRATILVAGVDALGIGLGAFVLGVPFASGIALLVFVGAYLLMAALTWTVYRRRGAALAAESI